MLEFSEIECFVPGDQCDLATEDGITFLSFQGRKCHTHEFLTQPCRVYWKFLRKCIPDQCDFPLCSLLMACQNKWCYILYFIVLPSSKFGAAGAVAFRDRLTFTTIVRECHQNWQCGKVLIYSHLVHYNIFRPQISHSISQIGYISPFLTASDKISLKDSNPLHAKPVIYIKTL